MELTLFTDTEGVKFDLLVGWHIVVLSLRYNLTLFSVLSSNLLKKLGAVTRQRETDGPQL
jgi:hypothetical protein